LYALKADRNNSARRSKFAVATAALCLVLLAFVSVLQVVHVHPTASDADHCQICIALHAVAPAAVAAAVIVLVQLGSPVLVPAVADAIRWWHPTLFTRPPPAAC